MQAISGKDKGKQGDVFKVIRSENSVLVSGLNIKFKHRAPDNENPMGSVVQKEFPIHVSNVALLDPESGRPTRVKFGYLEDGTKVRVSVRSGALLKKPERPDIKYIMRHHGKEDGIKDTAYDVALEQTYFGEDFEGLDRKFQDYVKEKEREAEWLVFPE